MSPVIGAPDVEGAFRELGLAGRPIEVHVSLRSFGDLDDGPATILEGILAAGSTVLATTMAPGVFGVPAPLDDRPPRNGIDYAVLDVLRKQSGGPEVFDPSRNEVATWLGGFSAYVAARPDRIRCRYGSGEFCAIGPLAEVLIRAETTDDVYGPLRALVEHDGAVILMGVGLTRMTLLHLAEVEAGRRPFIRWTRDARGRVVRVRGGECSEGFESLAPTLASVERTEQVGPSRWRVFPASRVLSLTADAIRENPAITRCANAQCIECDDAVAGGPLG